MSHAQPTQATSPGQPPPTPAANEGRPGMKGIEHRTTQTCSQGHVYLWQPGPGWCPYCDLSQAQRTKSLMDGSGKPEPCAPDCCATKGNS